MESQVEDKKRECVSYIKLEQERTIRAIYEKSEKVLNSETESFQSKIESLIDLWRQLSQCGVSPKIQYVINLMDWAKLHTLNIVLSGEWKKHKETYGDTLFFEVENCEKELYKLNNSFSLHCKKLLKVIQDPWGNSTLNRLLNTPDSVIEKEEFEFFMGESGYLISMRLKKLCESHCEDLALNLVTAYMRCCKFAESESVNMNLTDDQKRFMLDVYIALLFKYKKTSVILSTLKTLSLKDGLELVKRFAKKRVTISKLWRYANRITQLAAVLFCSTAVIQPIEESSEVLTALVDVWLTLCEKDDSLEPLFASIRKVIQVTISAPHMYIFCEALNRKFGPRTKIFNIELYVQALTTDLNLLERQKNEDDKQKVQETSSRLAEGLLQLAEVLNDHINVCRECILTSFSLQPTQDCLRKIEDIAKKCGHEVLDTGQWKCKLHPPISNEDEIGLQCQDCGGFMAQLQLSQALNTNTAFSEALTADRLGLSPELCDDLVVVVCSPRYQLLSWLQRWEDLHRLCIMYLEDPERTKNVVTELKFLDIDYSMFMNIKREPESEEEPFDNVIEPDYNPDFDEPPKPKKKRGRKKKVREQPEEEKDYLPYVAPKSDPHVLKTLRSFRRTFKRKIDSDTSVCSEQSSSNNSRAQNLKCARYGEFSSNTNFNYNSNSSYAEYLGRTFSEGAFRAHEDMFVTEGLYPQDMLYGKEDHFHNKYSTQIPCTSKEHDFIYYDNKQLTSSLNHHRQLSWCNNNNHAKNTVPEKQLNDSSITDEPHIDEQNFILNEFTNEITISAESQTDENKQSQTDAILKNLILAASNNNCNKSDDYKLYNNASSNYRNVPQYTPPSRSKSSVPLDSDNFAKDYSMKTLNLNSSREHGNVLAEENPQIHHDSKKITHSPKESPPKENPEKNLFREKLIETVFAEENGKMTKKFHKEKKSESIGNKENSDRIIIKKKNNKNLEQKNPEKLSPKPNKKSEIITDILDVPKKLNFQDVFQESLKSITEKTKEKDRNNRNHAKEIGRIKTIKDHNFQSNRKNKLNNVSSISDDSFNNKISSQSQNKANVDNTTKIKLKELRVILHRINLKFPVKKSDLYNSDVKKSPKKVQSANRDKFKSKKDEKKLFNKIFNNNNNLNHVQSQNNSPPADILKPLHDKNLRVVINDNDIIKPDLVENYLKYEAEKMKNSNLIPRVVLKRLEIDIPPDVTDSEDEGKNAEDIEENLNHKNKSKKADAKSVLANIPGLNDTELIQPAPVDSIVQVVQIAGGRQNSAVNSTNTQTSTQVSPHIQRIGQPRDKPETSTENTNTVTTIKTSTTNSKPASTQSPTLINILSQQIIRPGQSNSSRSLSGPLINILSQQVIRPANTTTTPTKTTTTVSSSEEQPSNNPRVMSGEPQIINQIVSPVRSSSQPIKIGASSESPSRIVQFICQSSDVKLIPMTSFTPNRVVKSSPKTKTEQTTENSEALPKFQQAFGKSVYQNNVDNTSPSPTVSNNVVSNNIEVEKPKVVQQQKNVSTTSVNVKPIQGGVIYTRQMPSGQTINLIPQTRGQVFRIATSNSEQISLVKDTVIHNKMSALLAAALQGRKSIEETETTTDSNSATQASTRVAIARPALVQNTRIVKPVLQIPSNVIRNTPQTNLSSTTLEQLREFDMVYKQVKERSSTNPSSEATSSEASEPSPQPQPQPQPQQPQPQQSQQQQPPPQQQQQQAPQQQRISVSYVNQAPKLNCAPVVVVSSYNSIPPAASPALSVASQGSSSPCVTPAPTPTPVLPKVTPKSSKGKSVKNTTMHTSKASPIPKPQQKPQEDEHTTQRIFDILAEYAEQLRNSPDLNNKPAPRRRSNPPTNPSQNSKRKKSSSSKKTGQCSSMSTDIDAEDPRTLGSEDSSCGVMQLSVPDEDQPATTASTSESNDSSAPRQQLILTDSSHNQTRNLIIADSVGEALKMPNTAVLVPGNYIMPVSMVKGGQQIAVVSGGSKILATVPARSGPNMLLFQSFLNQNRKSSVPTVKYSTIQPITGISSQSLAGVTAQPPVILPPPPHGISTVTLGQPIAVKKMDDTDRVNTELLLTISQSRENDSTPEGTPQPDSSTNVVSANVETVEIEETATLSDNSSDKGFSYQKPLIATPIATPVIAQTACPKEETREGQNQGTQTIMTLSLNAIDRKGESGKVEEQRVQSVLVTAGTSNGPMLSHSPPQYKQSHCSATATEQNKDDYLRNTEKKNNESKTYQAPNVYPMQGKVKKNQAGTQRLDRELQQLCLQRKQAALERELRLQKSLSEECEDLGVDEPSTSDLFPEAELLFDANHSPSFDQTSLDLLKRPLLHHHQDVKEETKLTLFGDDFLFETAEYQAAENDAEYDEDRSRLLTNGQSSTSTESESPCEDATLLQTCTSMSDVTLNSPISPDTYHPTTPPHVNKYVHKYSNRKKSDRVKQSENWNAEISSSEDTTGSTELIKSSSRSPDICTNKPSDEELSDGSYKLVRVAISKSECTGLHCSGNADCSLSGRGARRSVRKLCSCCNGKTKQEHCALPRKRPASQPPTPTPQKKVFPSKKR
ncbi:hypothetical protein Trydic_g21912 [Trypoxylus dichotomus]